MLEVLVPVDLRYITQQLISSNILHLHIFISSHWDKWALITLTLEPKAHIFFSSGPQRCLLCIGHCFKLASIWILEVLEQKLEFKVRPDNDDNKNTFPEVSRLFCVFFNISVIHYSSFYSLLLIVNEICNYFLPINVACLKVRTMPYLSLYYFHSIFRPLRYFEPLTPLMNHTCEP